MSGTAKGAFQGYAPGVALAPMDRPAAKPLREFTLVKGDKWDKSVMRINQHAWMIRRNIRRNIRLQLPQLAPYPPQPRERVCIVGGGWSLGVLEVFEELRQLYFSGAKLVALNGAADWLMKRNMRPSLHIVLDSRPENVEFVRTAIPKCRYMLASQCDPGLFDLCEDRDVTIFHLHNGVEKEPARRADPINRRLDSYYMGRWTKLPTAGTVGVVALMLCRTIGFQFQHLFGIDSCYAPDGVTHHAYPQALNDSEGSAEFITAGERIFRCSAWQASQAQNMVDMIASDWGQHLQLSVHGDGLIAHMLHEAAMQAETKEN